MEKRLKIAKKLLNPKDSVLIVTIDEKEYHHLACLLEEMFPEAKIQMISTVINPSGVSKDGFSRADEYIFFIMFGDATPARMYLGPEWAPSAIVSRASSEEKLERVEIGWTSMMRRGSNAKRTDRPLLYYPIYVNATKRTIEKIGTPIPAGQDRAEELDGLIQVLPIRGNGDQGRWQVGPEELKNRLAAGRVRVGRETTYGYVINYIPEGEYAKIETGEFAIEGKADDGSLIAYSTSSFQGTTRVAPTQWRIASHNAAEFGSSLIRSIFQDKRFTYPKSLYAVHDTIRFFVVDKPNALIIDFFAGSGTTLHAVNLLNAEDGGRRRCIMVTNNEVSETEAKDLTAHGYKPGNSEWERLGVAQYVTWPRTVCTIEGHDVNGNPLKGNYIGSDLPMSEGFKANAVFFKLGFLDKTSVALGQQFRELLPLLWLKAGSIGKCPEIAGDDIPPMLVLPENQFAVLVDESAFSAFEAAVHEHPEIQTVYLITDYAVNYRSMANSLKVANKYQLYRDYLDNFRINQGRA